MTRLKFKWVLGIIVLCTAVTWVTSWATVTSVATPRKTYSGNGVTTNFPITFPYNSDEDLVIVVHIDSGLVETTWVNGTEYTISSDTVVAGTAPATGEKLVLYRETPQKQETDLRPNRRFSADTEEAMFDKQVLMIQELDDAISRSARLSPTADESIDPTLPTPISGGLLGWNAALDGIENKTDLSAETVTVWSRTLLDDANRTAGRATLGVGLTAADVAAVIVLQGTGGYVDGEMVTTLDNGNRYTWDIGHSKWFVLGGNVYTTADLPTTANFTITTGTLVVDTTTARANLWNGSAWTDPTPWKISDYDYQIGLNTTLAADTAHDMTISAGICKDSTGAEDIELTAAITKRLDGVDDEWLAGDGNGGLEGAAVIDTKYYLFLIKHTDGTVDAGWDTASNASNLLTASGYTYYRMLDIMITGSSAAEIADHFQYAHRHNMTMRTGSYTGNVAGDNRNINIGIDLSACDYVWVEIKRDDVTTAMQYFGHMAGTDKSFNFTTSAGVANYIQDITSTGFEIGTGLNTNTSVYQYVILFQYGDN